MNTRVEVSFNSDITRAICKFLIQFQQQIIDNRYYYCSITYESIDTDINHNRRRQQRIFGTSQDNTVDLNFPQGSLLPGAYHFIVNATDGLNTTLIEGTFEKGESKLKIVVPHITKVVYCRLGAWMGMRLAKPCCAYGIQTMYA